MGKVEAGEQYRPVWAPCYRLLYPDLQNGPPMPLLLRLRRGAEYCDQPICLCVCLCVCVSVCLFSASICLEQLDRSSRNFVSRSPVAVAPFSSGGVALRYVLPVLWMTSHLAVIGATPKGGRCTVQRRRWVTWRYRGVVWSLWMLVVIF